jgi:fucose permease
MQRNGPTSLLLIAFLSFIIIGLPGGALGVAWLYIQNTFELGLDSLGLLLTFSTVGRLITAFTSGRLIARLGAGQFFLAGSLLSITGVLGFMLAPAWPFLLAAEFIRGMGSGVIDAGINTFVAPRYSASRLNWLHACFGIGLTFGPALVTVLVIDLAQSWRVAYAVLAALFMLLTAIFALTRKCWGTPEISDKVACSSEDVHIRDTLRLFMMWLCLALFFFYGGAEIGAGQLLNSLFVEGRGIDPKTSGFWVSFYWGSFTVGRMLIGIFVDRVGPRALLRACMMGTVLGALLIWWNATPEVSFAGLAVMGLSLAPVFPTLVAVTPDRVGIAHTPNAIGFQIGFAGLGAALLVGLAGIIADNQGRELIAPFLVSVATITLIVHEVILAREVRNPLLQEGR